MSAIDVAFDFRTDSGGYDPDAASPTLRRYHQLLWSKPLPDGRMLTVRDTPRFGSTPGYDLYASLDDGAEQTWGSDSVVVTHTTYESMRPIMSKVDDAVKENFVAIASTIGGYLLYPQNRIDRRWTINQARGCTGKISDRMDLTLECIRRHYLDPEAPTPLSKALGRYPEFFALFQDFRGYVDFWLLQDLVSPDHGEVNFFLPFDEFMTPRARTIEEWNIYQSSSVDFCNARNARIARWAAENLGLGEAADDTQLTRAE